MPKEKMPKTINPINPEAAIAQLELGLQNIQSDLDSARMLVQDLEKKLVDSEKDKKFPKKEQKLIKALIKHNKKKIEQLHNTLSRLQKWISEKNSELNDSISPKHQKKLDKLFNTKN